MQTPQYGPPAVLDEACVAFPHRKAWLPERAAQAHWQVSLAYPQFQPSCLSTRVCRTTFHELLTLDDHSHSENCFAAFVASLSRNRLIRIRHAPAVISNISASTS